MNNSTTTEQVWRDYKNALEVFILSKVKDRDCTDDILQEVFVKVHLNLHSLKDEYNLKPWIYQIARNSVQDYFRKKRFLVDVDKVDIVDEKDNSDSVGLQKCMTPFVNKLPKKYKEALVLSDFYKIGQIQLAQRLKISYSGTKSRVQRARKLLYSYFIECCDITSDKYGNIISHTPKNKCLRNV